MIGLGPIVLDFPYILEELTDKSNSEKPFLVLVILNINSNLYSPSVPRVILQYIDNRNKTILDVRVEGALTKD
jgi:hypothetical protein